MEIGEFHAQAPPCTDGTREQCSREDPSQVGQMDTLGKHVVCKPVRSHSGMTALMGISALGVPLGGDQKVDSLDRGA